jgi:acetate kinase
MQNSLLVLNSGSSSLKFSLFVVNGKNLDLVTRDTIEIAADTEHAAALQKLLQQLNEKFNQYKLCAVGHRVVHGGELYMQPTRIDEKVLTQLERFIPLAPLHQPYNLAAIKILREQQPDLLQVACFDTAFHHTQTAIAQAYALPDNVSDLPIKRYGFHGLSYEYIASVLPEHLGATKANGKIIVAHLGHGASLCALHNRQSIATTMGFTALEGLPMGTRCGSLDPGVLLYLLTAKKMTPDQLTELLYKRSGLLGVSGISDDVRILLKSSDPRAKAALDLFVYRIHHEIGSLIAALNGLDALIFTAGIGENSAVIRKAICDLAAWLGIKLDTAANEQNKICISTPDSAISVWVIPTNEELMIAQHCLQI